MKPIYRGKTTNHVANYWVRGCYVYDEFSDCIRDYAMEYHFVNPETVGRYVGKKDKNKKPIFVGDILKDVNENLFLVVEESTRVVLKTQERRVCTWLYVEKNEIIGNIYDNPELWNGGNRNG